MHQHMMLYASPWISITKEISRNGNFMDLFLPTKSEILGVGPETCISTNLPGDSDACSRLRICTLSA